MKKVLFMVAFLATSMIASAQIYVGGSVGFNKTDNNGAKTTTYTIAPEVGYTLNDSWSFGAVFEYSDMDNDLDNYSVNPYARYTFYRAGAFSMFVDGTAKVGKINDETGWGVGAKPGIAYSLNEKFSIVSHLGYIGYQDNDDVTKFGFDFDNALSFGLYYSF